MARQYPKRKSRKKPPRPPKTKRTPAQQAIHDAKLEARRAREKARRERFFRALDDAGIPIPEFEYRFHSVRRWRMDYCWPRHMVFVEQEGGVHIGGRHTTPQGFLKDMEKYNTAVSMGYRGPLRCTPSGLTAPEFIDLIKRTLSFN